VAVGHRVASGEDADARVLVDGDHARRLAARDDPTPRLHQRLLARVGDPVHPDLAWAYDFPTRQLQPIVGLVAFYNEQVDVRRQRRAPAAADDALLPIGAVAHAGSARRELVLGDRVLEVVRERVRAPRPDVGEHRVVEALLELRAHRLAVGDRQQHR
jgi:hypothetical protein